MDKKGFVTRIATVDTVYSVLLDSCTGITGHKFRHHRKRNGRQSSNNTVNCVSTVLTCSTNTYD